MKNATKVFVSTFGAIMALAGLEHGIGEVLQGNVAPSGMMILSWPGSAFFSSLGGEPALTILPNLLATGILAILFSLALLGWVTRFVQRKDGGQVMILLSLAMLLFGGGIFPPVLAFFIGLVGTRIHTPIRTRRGLLPAGFQRFLGRLWPLSFMVCLIAWPALVPGIPILNYFFGVDDPVLILVILGFALGSLPLTALCGLARDSGACSSNPTETDQAVRERFRFSS